MTLTVAPEVASLVRPAWCVVEHLVVRDRDARQDEPLARAAAAMRTAAESADITAAVRTMYKRVGIDPTKTRPSSEALLPPRHRRKGRRVAADQQPRRDHQLDVPRVAVVVRPVRRRSRARRRRHAAIGPRRRRICRHPEGRRAPGRPSGPRRRGRAVRQPDLRFRADDGDDGDEPGASGHLRAGSGDAGHRRPRACADPAADRWRHLRRGLMSALNPEP